MAMGLMGTLHGLDFFATSMLLGFVVFTSWIAPRADEDGEWRNYSRGLVLVGIAFFVTLAWFLVTAADMAESWRLAGLLTVLTRTTFGHLCAVKCLCLIFLVTAMGATRWRLSAALAVVLPAVAAFTGHAGAAESNSWWLITTDYLHFLSVGVWTGGLLALALYLHTQSKFGGSAVATTYATVRRFSHLAMISTAAGAVTGSVLAYQYGPFRSWQALGTDYGKLVTLKVVLFSCALLTAAVNQFIHLRGWSETTDQHFTTSVFGAVCVELVVAFLVFVAAGHLTRMVPSLS